MKPIKFSKLHGFGNDYAVVEADQLAAISDLAEFTRAFCHRNTGVGADGIAILEKVTDDTADFSCRIINPDGSEAGFSGNGTRCAVAYAFYKSLWSDKNLRLQTKSGVKNYELLQRDEETFWFLAEIGQPKFELPPSVEKDSMPPNNQKEFGFLMPSEEIAVRLTFVDVGNPVAVIFVKNFDNLNWRRIGAKIENAPLFPDRTNVVFVKIVDRENIEIRIWERGAGETSSSGTCSAAAAVASAYTERAGRKTAVHAPGGTTEVVWREDGEMLITGRADPVFDGEYFL